MFHQHEPFPYTHLVETALKHVQFEANRSFVDDNGRIGRLLIPLRGLHEVIER